MAITFTKYDSYEDDLLEGNIDLDSDTIKVALVTSSYTFSAAHDFFNDITNELSTAGGYTAGGATIGSPTISSGVFDAADTMWTSSTFTCAGAVVYKSTGDSATSPLIGFIDFDGDQSPADQTFKIVWNAGGIIAIS
jgi:hypothetical protein